MKAMRLCATLILSAIAAASVRVAAQSSPPASSLPVTAGAVSPAQGPIIQVDRVEYDFGRVTSSEKIRHTYILTNAGNQLLEIANVHPGCHCTTAGDWTHKIAPGQSGEITVQLDTIGMNGPVTRTIEVTSNAKNEPRKTLLLKGTVWKPIEMFPSAAFISIPPDATNEASTTVRVVNHTDQPVAISNAVSASGRFRVALKETKPGKEYELLITAEPPFAVGNTPGTITVNTSLSNVPSVSVTAIANVTAAVQTYPNQIVLNSLPDRWTTNRVTIRGNSATPLTLSNPKASDSRIHIEIQPAGARGTFALLAAFPPGFHVAPGQRAELTVESNHPRFPVIKIPVVEYPRPRPYAAIPAHPNPPAQPAGHP